MPRIVSSYPNEALQETPNNINSVRDTNADSVKLQTHLDNSSLVFFHKGLRCLELYSSYLLYI
jgi:hypothetical protein